ncbi:MAG TPA: M20 aminoacylase family protein [Xanthobacteraceae bacterium]|jgi:amidohydrolase|nr:M20 aminoacylase family protein [Xanthobacteraceae bacterium]
MPIVNRVADLHAEIAAWRHDLHAHPELLYEVHRTAASVADKLQAFGCDEVVAGIGRTGVVGVIKGNRAGGVRKVIGLRADMDALPLQEANELPYKSTVPGKMHACGHDGHTAMLLGAAKYLAETRNFAGTAVVIFQPAEEGGAGGLAMVKDGLMDRFGIEEVYGMHNFPGLPVGEFSIRSGAIMASTDNLTIEIEGVGGHAARPHFAVDPVLVGAQIVNNIQSIVSRNIDPLDAAVVSICVFQAGHADNVIPQTARLRGTARSLRPEVRDALGKRLHEVVEATAKVHGATAKLNLRRGYPVLRNHERETAFAASIAGEIAGTEHVDTDMAPVMGAEDFSYMLEARPGAFIFVGNGDTAGLHHQSYDFNDDIIPIGTSYWVRLVETAMAG